MTIDSLFFFFFLFIYSTTVAVLFVQCFDGEGIRVSLFPPVSFFVPSDDQDGGSQRWDIRDRGARIRETLRRAEELSSRRKIIVDASKNVSQVVLLLFLLPNFFFFFWTWIRIQREIVRLKFFFNRSNGKMFTFLRYDALAKFCSKFYSKN